jgi:hypothetical protein
MLPFSISFRAVYARIRFPGTVKYAIRIKRRRAPWKENFAPPLIENHARNVAFVGLGLSAKARRSASTFKVLPSAGGEEILNP